MMSEQSKLQKNLEEERDKLSDIIMEENYQKSLKAKEENRLKEKRNIFISDLSVYKKINKNKNTSVPDFFMAKYVVLDYLDKNKYFETENLESPSDELFELFTILYNSSFVEDYEPQEGFEDVILDFIDSLPDIEILTEKQFHDKLNKLTEYGMFSTDIVRN